MAEVCSCGTRLVEDALFCHRCGKPQRPLVAAEVEPEAPAAPPPPLVEPRILPVNFRNSIAVRIGFLVASVASMLDAMTMPMFVIWSACAGFAAVWLYRRSTGQNLTVRGGASMGWITGVLNSVIVIVLTTISFAASVSEVTATFRQQVSALAAKDPTNYAKVLPYLESPYAIAIGMIFTLVFLFIAFTVSCVAGGALGARFIRKRT